MPIKVNGIPAISDKDIENAVSEYEKTLEVMNYPKMHKEVLITAFRNGLEGLVHGPKVKKIDL